VARVPTRSVRDCRRVRTTSGAPLPAGSVRTGRRGLTRKIPAGNGRNGPAMRPKHPHAAESGVGEHTARESERAQQCAIGKERVANAHPHIWPRSRKVPGPYCFLVASLRPNPGVLATKRHQMPRNRSVFTQRRRERRDQSMPCDSGTSAPSASRRETVVPKSSVSLRAFLVRRSLWRRRIMAKIRG